MAVAGDGRTGRGRSRAAAASVRGAARAAAVAAGDGTAALIAHAGYGRRMTFRAPPDQPSLSPWRWRRDAPWSVGRFALELAPLIPLAGVVLYVHGHHYGPAPSTGLHTWLDDLGAGPLAALCALTVLAAARGNAAFTLARDLAMIALAAGVVTVFSTHPHLHASVISDNRQDRETMIWILLTMVARLAIDLVRLRLVFVALRARRRLPRATVRRR